MRYNKRILFYTSILLMFCMILGFILQKSFQNNAIFIGIITGIISAFIVTIMTTLIGYFESRRKELEKYYVDTLTLLNNLNHYDENWRNIDKVKFLYELSMNQVYENINWDYGQIDFLFTNKTIRKNIFNKIYSPLNTLRNIQNENKSIYNQFINESNKETQPCESLRFLINEKIQEFESYWIKKEIKNNISVSSNKYGDFCKELNLIIDIV